jgi:hypothetical protein
MMLLKQCHGQIEQQTPKNIGTGILEFITKLK